MKIAMISMIILLILGVANISWAIYMNFSTWQAVKTAENALDQALSEKQKDLAEEIRYHLQLFREGQPYIQK